ncbi:MAG: DJ-1/PfpI family protein [Candidatus Sulfotelmatobacter sp.]
MTADPSVHINIGAIIFPNMDQCDFTGPFEVLSRLPDSTFHVVWKRREPIRDYHGLILTPETDLAECPKLDLLVIPGGHGQEALMDDEEVLSFVRSQSRGVKYVFSVCTGALICGAAGLLKGVKATTHWSAVHLLEYYGAIPTDARVVVDGKIISAAGVTAGLDGALVIASLLRGEHTARQIQLAIQYAPDPPFDSGSPEKARPEILEAAQRSSSRITGARLATAKRLSAKLGVR